MFLPARKRRVNAFDDGQSYQAGFASGLAPGGDRGLRGRVMSAMATLEIDTLRDLAAVSCGLIAKAAAPPTADEAAKAPAKAKKEPRSVKSGKAS